MRPQLVILLLMFFVFDGGCQSGEVNKIEFTSLTRGYQKTITVTPDSVVMIIEGRDNQRASRAIQEKEWASLLSSIRNIELEEIPRLESPSNKRAYDGALHSTISIHTGRSGEWSHSFDDDDPHPYLAPLLKAVYSLL